MKIAYLSISTAIIIALYPTTAVSSEPTLAKAVAACAQIQDDSKRLVCFDNLAKKTADPKEPDSMAQDAQEAAFGAETLRAREKSFAQAQGQEDNSPKEMTFTILEAGKNRAGKYFFIMENGQVWRQLKADGGKFRIPKKVTGTDVTIKRKLFGSHLLTLKGHSIKVKRLK